MIRKIGTLCGGLGILAAAIAALSLTACDQAPTKTEAPKVLTPEEARKIRQDKFDSASSELDKVRAELNATQDKLENVIGGTEKGDVEELATHLKELQDRMNMLKDQMAVLGRPVDGQAATQPIPESKAPAIQAPVSATPANVAPPQK